LISSSVTAALTTICVFCSGVTTGSSRWRCTRISVCARYVGHTTAATSEPSSTPKKHHTRVRLRRNAIAAKSRTVNETIRLGF